MCWDKTILKYLKAELVDDVLSDKKEEGKPLSSANSKDYQTSSDWFAEAQKFMALNTAGDMGKLIGKLYRASEKAADGDCERFLRNPDAEAYADAYYQALEHSKHGTEIYLPHHLWFRIPTALHKYLKDIP